MRKFKPRASGRAPVQLEHLESRQLLSAGSAPADLTPFNGKLFFTADDGAHGRELWVSDGLSGGTSLVKDINPGTASSNIRNLTVVGSKIFFSATNGTNGQELWMTDGTAANTKLVKDIFAGGTGSNPSWLAAVGTNVYFGATTAKEGNEVWRSDGTANGTVLVADVNPGAASSNPTQFTQVGTNVFFSAQTVTSVTTGTGKKAKTTKMDIGLELFKTNGTAAGTSLVKDINPGFGHSLPSQLLSFNSKLYFTAYTDTWGWELWSSDGSTAGTNIVKDLYPGLTGSNPMNLRKFNGSLFFNAQASLGGGPTDGLRLWKSDGTAGGTVTAQSLVPGFTGYIPANFDYVNGIVFFESEDMEGLKLWRTDGTAAGTFSLGIQQNHQVMQLGEVITTRKVAGSDVFFSAVNSSNGNELYVTDGSIANTKLVKDIFPGNGPFDPTPTLLTDVNGKLFFVDDDGITGSELWTSDGTFAGTTLVKDILP